MKISLLLLISALVLMVHPPLVHSNSSLARKTFNFVYEHAKNCSTFKETKAVFVEDVSHLAEGHNRCKDLFFCKVQDILGKLKGVCDNREILVRTLNTYHTHRHVNCSAAVEGVTHTGVEITAFSLLKNLIICIRHRNFNGQR